MSAKTINSRIKQKRDTDSNWQSNNPILLNGEIVLVDTSDGELRAKIGDGTSAYNLLSFTDEPLRELIDTIDSRVDTIHGMVGDTSVSEQINNALSTYDDSDSDIYVQNDEPADALEGSLWVDLDEEGASGAGSIELDTTLTLSGYAADAQAVGNAIAGINSVPACTTANDGQILCVVDGAAAWQTIETWAGGSY